MAALCLVVVFSFFSFSYFCFVCFPRFLGDDSFLFLVLSLLAISIVLPVNLSQNK